MRNEIKNTSLVSCKSSATHVSFSECLTPSLSPFGWGFFVLNMEAFSHSTSVLISSSKINCVEALMCLCRSLALNLCKYSKSMCRAMLLV